MTHILLDIKYKEKEPVLYDKNRGESIINNWCEYNNHLLVMPPVSHVFPCYEQNDYNGYTSIGLLKESHISIHTYPEHNSIQIDFFSCKNLDKRQNEDYMERVFKKSHAVKYDCRFIARSVV